MIVGRLIGAALLVVALAALCHEAYAAVGAGAWRFIAGGEIWARIDGNSLVGFQALVEKGVAPWLWSDVALPILLAPAWAIPLVPAVLLLWLARRRRPRGGFSR